MAKDGDIREEDIKKQRNKYGAGKVGDYYGRQHLEYAQTIGKNHIIMRRWFVDICTKTILQMVHSGINKY